MVKELVNGARVLASTQIVRDFEKWVISFVILALILQSLTSGESLNFMATVIACLYFILKVITLVYACYCKISNSLAIDKTFLNCGKLFISGSWR